MDFLKTKKNKLFINNLDLKKISRYRFSKIDNFNYFDPTLVFYNDDLIFLLSANIFKACSPFLKDLPC